MIAEIIAVGSEMLTPFRQDTNSLFLTRQLNQMGVVVAFKTIVGDTFDHLVGVARASFERSDLIIFSGGLGPTEDDLTRECVAAALGVDLRRDHEIITAMYKRFRRASHPDAAQQRQAGRRRGRRHRSAQSARHRARAILGDHRCRAGRAL